MKNINNKMSINTYLSTIESKKQNKKQAEQKQNNRTLWWLPDGRESGKGEEGEGIKQHTLVVTE